MAAGLAITSIYNVINSYFVGHYGTVEELAATGYGVPVFGIIMAIAGVFGLGSSTLASRLLGEGNETRIRNVTSFAPVLCARLWHGGRYCRVPGLQTRLPG